MAQGRTQHPTRTTRTPPQVPPTDSGTAKGSGSGSRDPQIRKMHETAGTDDGPGRGNDVPVERGGARHRQK